MPPRKEPKEQVIYPSSRAKTPAYKPLRRLPTAESQSSVTAKPTAKKVAPNTTSSKPKKKPITLPDSDEEDDDDDDDSNDEESSTLPTIHKDTLKRKASAISIASSTTNQQPQPKPPPSFLPDSENNRIPGIPQPLLLRLLHESFSNKDTKIDTHALAIVQKYMEVFVRETIARCIAEKKEAGERGEVAEMDVGWLELDDLEKVIASMMLDF